MLSTLTKSTLVFCALLAFTAFGLSSQVTPSAAQAPTLTPTATATDDPVVEIEFEGVVAQVTPTSITLVDGTTVRVEGVPIPPEVIPGTFVHVLARFEGDELLLLQIVVIVDVTPTLTFTPSPTFTPSATATITTTPDTTLTPTLEITLTPSPTLEITVEPTSTALCPEALNGHPVGQRLADTFGVSYEEIMSWKCAGFGFGEIARAYGLAAETGIPVADIFAMKTAGMGWGNIVKAVRSQSGSSDTSDTMRITAKTKKGAASDSDQGTGKGKDNGKGNGKNNGNGNGKGNGKGNGNGKK